MSEWKKVKIGFETIKLGDYIEPIKNTVAELGMKNPVVYGVTNTAGIVQTGKPASKDISNYIALQDNCFAFNPYRINVGSIGINDAKLEGCVSPAYVVFKTKNGLLPKFLYFYLKSDYGIHLINWYGNRGGVRNALRYSDLCNIDIPDIRKFNQQKLLKRFSDTADAIRLLSNELEKQKEYTKQLRQNILQEAIEGKVTTDWREEHPVIKGNPDYDAEALFAQIQKEKQADKKQKQLPPIADEEKPFAIPDGWKWVRFGTVIDIATNTVDSSDYKTMIQISPDDIEKCTGRLLYPLRTVAEKEIISVNHLFSKNMLIYSKIRPRLRKVVYVDFDGLCSADMYPLRTTLNYKYVKYVMLSDYFDLEVFKFDNRVKMPKVNQPQLNSIMIPMPPLAEQIEISRKINKFCDILEMLGSQISEREQLTKQLMQSILKGAFEEE